MQYIQECKDGVLFTSFILTWRPFDWFFLYGMERDMGRLIVFLLERALGISLHAPVVFWQGLVGSIRAP